MAQNLSTQGSALVALSTTATLVAADTGPSFPRRVILTAALISAAAATTVTFQSHTTTGVSTKVLNIPVGTTVLPYNQDGWFTTAKGEALDVVVGAGGAATISFNWTYS
jgi:hypothetical protein